MSENKKKRIIYLSYDGLTDPLGQSQIIPYLSGLAAYGHQITVVSAEKPQNFNNKEQLIKSLLDSHQIMWVPLNYTKKPPVLSTILDLIKFSRAVKKIYRNNPFDIIHCRSYITSIVGLNVQQKYGVRFVFDMRGFWADERIDGNIWKLSNPLYRLVYRYFKNKEKQFLFNADHTVSLTKSAIETIRNDFKISLPEDRYSVIPCCADLDHFSTHKNNSQNKSTWRKKLSIEQHAFVLTYLGSLGTWYMIDEMLSFFKVLTEKHRTDAVFVFITQDNPAIVYEAINRHQIPESAVRVIRSGRYELPEMLAISDAAVSFIKPSFSKRASSPTKLAELLGLGIPVFSNTNVGDIEIYYQSIESLKITDLKTKAFEKAWTQFFTHPPETERLVEVANHFFSLHLGVEKYVNVYRNL